MAPYEYNEVGFLTFSHLQCSYLLRKSAVQSVFYSVELKKSIGMIICKLVCPLVVGDPEN